MVMVFVMVICPVLVKLKSIGSLARRLRLLYQIIMCIVVLFCWAEPLFCICSLLPDSLACFQVFLVSWIDFYSQDCMLFHGKWWVLENQHLTHLRISLSKSLQLLRAVTGSHVESLCSQDVLLVPFGLLGPSAPSLCIWELMRIRFHGFPMFCRSCQGDFLLGLLRVEKVCLLTGAIHCLAIFKT